jgi:hypothetical protein
MEFEVQFVVEGRVPVDTLHMHLACFSTWELERHRWLRAAAR